MRRLHTIMNATAVAALTLSVAADSMDVRPDPGLLVTDLGTLAALETAGASLSQLLGDPAGRATNRDLLRQPTYRSLVSDLREAIDAVWDAKACVSCSSSWTVPVAGVCTALW